MNKRILVVGDSWSASYEDGKGDVGYWLDLLNISSEYRQAISGSTATEWASDFNGRLTKAINTPCDCVVMSLLGNDFYRIFSDNIITEQEISEVSTAMLSVTKKLLEFHKEVYVILYTNPFTDIKSIITFTLFINGLKLCCSPGVKFITSSDILTSSDFDGVHIHPLHDSYAKLAALIESSIK